MSERPDWVHCIERYREDEKGKSWCGRDVHFEWKFLSAEHAMLSVAHGDRMLACPACVGVLRPMLEAACWDGKP
jgi:hypothetical protein